MAGFDLSKKIRAERVSNTMVVCMDLQQALPTPKVSKGIALRKTKIWAYIQLQHPIHIYIIGIGHMFIWDEVFAKRGALEVCRCNDKFISLFVPETGDELVLFLDNCAGQEKKKNK